MGRGPEFIVDMEQDASAWLREHAITTVRAAIEARKLSRLVLRYVEMWNDLSIPDPKDEMGTSDGDQLLVDMNAAARSILSLRSPERGAGEQPE